MYFIPKITKLDYKKLSTFILLIKDINIILKIVIFFNNIKKNILITKSLQLKLSSL